MTLRAAILAAFTVATAAIDARFAPAAAAPEAPLVGPGSVRDAAERFLRALDEGDGKAAARLLRPLRSGYAWKGESSGPAESALSVFGHGAPGSKASPWSATTQKELEAGGLPALAHPELGRPRSTLVTTIADCPSGICSYALLEVDRTWGEGESAVVQHLRVTALLEHVDDRRGFVVTHWHASPRDVDA